MQRVKLALRKIGIVTTIVCAATATAAAAAGARSISIFKAGAQTGRTQAGLTLSVTGRKFAVLHLAYSETCTGGGPTIKDEFAFVAGKGAHFVGVIGKNEHFSGRFTSVQGFVQVSGTIHGRSVIFSSTERTHFAGAKDGQYKCRGSARFRGRS